jgi:hypothetical protein
MDANVSNDASGAAIHGYSRAEVDDFLEAAAVERARLEVEIADARARAGRARSAIGMHRVMVSMLLETQRELTELRLDAEARAEQIVAEAEREANEMLAASGASGWTHDEPFTLDPQAPITSMIDLVGVAEQDGGVLQANGVEQNGRASHPSVDPSAGAEPEPDEYFDFLRGALADDSPLGPKPE